MVLLMATSLVWSATVLVVKRAFGRGVQFFDFASVIGAIETQLGVYE
jgi:hypothetical protein